MPTSRQAANDTTSLALGKHPDLHAGLFGITAPPSWAQANPACRPLLLPAVHRGHAQRTDDQRSFPFAARTHRQTGRNAVAGTSMIRISAPTTGRDHSPLSTH